MIRSCSFLLCLLTTSAFGVELGDRAPNIIGKFLGGERNGEWFRLNRAPAQPTLVNFFWVDCLPCAEELPELARLERQCPRVRFLAVHAEDDDAEAILQYLAKLPAHPRNIFAGLQPLTKSLRRERLRLPAAALHRARKLPRLANLQIHRLQRRHHPAPYCSAQAASRE